MQISADQKNRLLAAIDSRLKEFAEERKRHSHTVSGKWRDADEAKAESLDASMRDLELLHKELNKPTGQINW